MQRIFLGLMALLILAACTPKASTTMADKVDMADKTMDKVETMVDFRAKAPTAGPAPEINIGDFQDFKLDNGLQVVLVENHKLPRVSYQLFIDVPQHMEGKYAGASSMMGSMLRRATSDMTKEEIDEAVDFIGANLSTSGSGAFASTISKYKEQVIDLMGKVVLDAQFPAEEFDKVKDDALAGLQSSLANPDAIAGRVRSVLTYGTDHPYGELSTEESLKNVNLDVVKKYYADYFVPNRSYLVMVGDLTRSEAEMLAKKTFGNWKVKEVVEPTFEMPTRPEGVVVSFVPRAGSVQSVITITHPIDLKPGTTDAIQAGIVNSILGSGFNSRLFQNLREDKAYTYGAGSGVSENRLVGNFRASTSVRNEVTDSAVVELMMEITKISKEPVTSEELNRAKSQLNGSFGRALESPQRIASYALNTVRNNLSRDFYPTYLKQVEATTADDLLRVAGQVISPQGTHIVVVGDKAVADKLARFATSGKVNFLDVNGMAVDMEEIAAPTDLTAKSVIQGYIDAIGGQAAIDKVKNFTMVMEASIQGQTMTQSITKSNGMIASSMTMMGMNMMEQRFDGTKAMMKQQGQSVPVTDDMIAALKDEAELFPVVALLSKVETITMDGVEMIDGKKVAVLSVPSVGGGSTTRYFDLESKLQVRQVSVQGPQTATYNISDYKAINGVLFPYSLSITGMAPFPINMKVKDAKVNTEVDPAIFSVE